MVNIIANRHKAGVPRIKDNGYDDLHYHSRDFKDHPWRTQMQRTSIFPVDTLHFPNGQWYWARIVASVDDNGTTAEGDIYVFDPGFEPSDTDAGKAYGKWAEVYNYDGNITAYIGSDRDVPTSGYNASELDYYETLTIDDAVAWVNSTMLNLVNTIASRHKAAAPKLEGNASNNYGWNDLYYTARDFNSKPWKRQMQATNLFPVDTLHFPNGQWYWARKVVKDGDFVNEGDMYLFDPGFAPDDTAAGEARGKWGEVTFYEGCGSAAIGDDSGIGGPGSYDKDEYDYLDEIGSVDEGVNWVNNTMLELVRK